MPYKHTPTKRHGDNLEFELPDGTRIYLCWDLAEGFHYVADVLRGEIHDLADQAPYTQLNNFLFDKDISIRQAYGAFSYFICVQIPGGGPIPLVRLIEAQQDPAATRRKIFLAHMPHPKRPSREALSQELAEWEKNPLAFTYGASPRGPH